MANAYRALVEKSWSSNLRKVHSGSGCLSDGPRVHQQVFSAAESLPCNLIGMLSEGLGCAGCQFANDHEEIIYARWSATTARHDLQMRACT